MNCKVTTGNIGNNFDEFAANAKAKGEEKYASLIGKLFSPEAVRSMVTEAIIDRPNSIEIPFDAKKYTKAGIYESEAFNQLVKQLTAIPIIASQPGIRVYGKTIIGLPDYVIEIAFDYSYLEPVPEPEPKKASLAKRLMAKFRVRFTNKTPLQLKTSNSSNSDDILISRINKAAENLTSAVKQIKLEGINTNSFSNAIQEIGKLFKETGGQRHAVRALIFSLEGTVSDFVKFSEHSDKITGEHRKDLTTRFKQEAIKVNKIKDALITDKINDAHLGIVVRSETFALRNR